LESDVVRGAQHHGLDIVSCGCDFIQIDVVHSSRRDRGGAVTHAECHKIARRERDRFCVGCRCRGAAR
jgi:hypothetical protein